MDLMRITDDLTMVNEGHVGGFIIEKDPATYTPHLWEYLCKKFNIKTVLDVGCGMGHAEDGGWGVQLSRGTPIGQKGFPGFEKSFPGSCGTMEAGSGKRQAAGAN